MNTPPVNRRLQRQIIFAFMFFFAAALFVVRPDATRGQLIFRVAMAALGLAGFVVVSRQRR